MDNAVALAAIALASTTIVGMFAVIKIFIASVNANTSATGQLVKETKRGNDASEKRNGHLGELVIQQGIDGKHLAENAANTIIQAFQNVQTQNVDTLNVKQATVTEETVKHETVEGKS